jgi:uncharacterized DUF497 family protein
MLATNLTWDEAKREANIEKHGLDFIDAVMVLQSAIRFDVEVVRGDEERIQSFAYVFDVLAVLTVVHTEREDTVRVISFRRASSEEKEFYHEQIAEDGLEE